jgi:hypothetical protein
MDRRESDVARRDLVFATCSLALSRRVGASLADLSRRLAFRWVSGTRVWFALVMVAIALAVTIATIGPSVVGGKTFPCASRRGDQSGRRELAGDWTDAPSMLGSRAGSRVQADSYQSRGLPIL